ncbi:MAG: hydrogenase maturation protein HypF [Hyphomicrobiales bacterium]|nr:hydrogenase maturation protein HypF [Hyphomicrobiales bacterium]
MSLARARADSVVATALRLPFAVPPAVGMGPFLKATVAVVDGDRAWVSHDVGNLDSAAAIAAYEDTLARLLDETGVAPRAAGHDLHPDFHSTRLAQGLGLELELELGLAPVPVQHHQAHIAAVAAENGHPGPLLGLALDGFGLGPGDQSWGGELLYLDGAGYARRGHLAPLPQPGGDVAAREPWRMGAAVLHRLGRGGEIAARFAGQPHAAMLEQVLDRNLNCPPTSSAGRLFDAACGLLGLRPVAEFEGQAPMELESLVTRPRVMADGWTLEDGVLDLLPLMDTLPGRDPADGADLFHGTLAAALVDWAAAAGVATVGLSGGCFFNRVLTRLVAEGLAARGMTVLRHGRVSPGDPGVSLGQAWVAAQTVA